MPTYSKKVIHNAWQTPVSVLYYSMNENPELDLETQRLIDAACEGVEVPSDEEVEATQQVQNWDLILLQPALVLWILLDLH